MHELLLGLCHRVLVERCFVLAGSRVGIHFGFGLGADRVVFGLVYVLQNLVLVAAVGLVVSVG